MDPGTASGERRDLLLLCIVSRSEPRLYGYLERAFSDTDAIEVLRDRRQGDRRARRAPVTGDRRRGDRRSLDLRADLRGLGWAFVLTGPAGHIHVPSRPAFGSAGPARASDAG